MEITSGYYSSLLNDYPRIADNPQFIWGALCTLVIRWDITLKMIVFYQTKRYDSMIFFVEFQVLIFNVKYKPRVKYQECRICLYKVTQHVAENTVHINETI